MTPTERLAQVLDKLHLTTMPRYWADTIVRELASHGITLEINNGPTATHGQGNLLPQRNVPAPGGLLPPGPEQGVPRENLGKRQSSARLEYRGATWDPNAPM